MKKNIIFAAVFVSMLISFNAGICRSWDDLDEGEHEIYGSEKEEKFPVKTFFMEKELWDNHSSIMVLWLFKHTDYPRYRSTRFIPFYYNRDSKIDNRSETVWPLFLSYYETDGASQTSAFIFPLYYSSIDADEADRSLLWPFIWWGKNQYKTVNSSYQTVFPLFYHRGETDSKSGHGEFVWINPLFVSWREMISFTEEKEHMWWFPIVPLTYHYTDRYYGHRNYIWLIDYSWDIVNGEDRMKRFWFLPVYLWERGDDGYTAILPPLYINNRHRGGDYYYHILPFFTTWEEKTGGFRRNGFATLIFSKYNVTDIKSGEEIYSNIWFPVIPLVFRSRDRDSGTHTNIAWIIDWERDKEENLKNFWFVPFIFHETGESGYKYWIPFYCRPSGATEKDGYTFGLFHYYSWRSSGRTLWSWLYYKNEEYVEKAPAKGGTVPAEKEEYYYKHFIPVYWSWRSAESTGRLIFPLVFSYKDKQTDIHVITGFALKTFMGPFTPDVGLGLGKKDDTWYLDTDYSWLYNVVSVSSRIPVRNPFGEKGDKSTSGEKISDSDAVVPGKTTEGDKNNTKSVVVDDSNSILMSESNTVPENGGIKPAITKKRGMNRENSEYFWGWQLLFGWMAWESADSQRHFRLLPLAWLTWDKDANDKLVTVLPFFLWYQSEETKEEYFVAAPFYAAQYQDRSYTKAYLLNLYWDEYRAEENCYEKTILWPIVNWYSSPEMSGFRIFPLVWHKNWKEGGDEASRTLAPLYFSKDILNKQTGEYKLHRRINPLYYVNEKNDGAYSSYTLFAPLIPLFYHGSESDGVISTEKTITPLFYYSGEERKETGAVANDTTLWVPLLPIFYKRNYGESYHWNFLGVLDRCRDKDYKRFFLFPLYYSTEEKGENHHNILGVIDWWGGESGTDTSMVFPLYRWSGDDKSSSIILFPLLTYLGSEPGEKTCFVAGVYWHSSPGFERQNILYIFDHKKYTGEKYLEDSYSMMFTTMKYDISPEIREMRLLWGTLFKYTGCRNSDNYDIDALLWLAGVEREGSYFHNRVLPLYWYSSDRDETTLVVPPILSYFSKESNGDFDLGVLGLVYYRNEDKRAGEDRRMWLLGALYDEVKAPERRYHSRGSLWGVLWDYETEGETDFTKFTILKGLYKYREEKGETKHTFFWVF